MRYLLLAALAAVLLPACGGGEEATPDEAAAQGAGRVVQVTLSDFTIHVDSTALDAGEYTLRVVNDGGTVHALDVDGPTGEVESAKLGPGEFVDLAVDLSQSGDYELYCPVDGHRGRGMETAVAVGGRGGGGGGGTTTEETTTEEDSDYRY